MIEQKTQQIAVATGSIAAGAGSALDWWSDMLGIAVSAAGLILTVLLILREIRDLKRKRREK